MALGTSGLERTVGVPAGSLTGYQGGAALLWKMADLRGPSGLFITPGLMKGQMPSRGARWSGVSIRITVPAEPFGLDGIYRRIGRGMRLRSLAHPNGMMETILASHYTWSLCMQGLLALKAGDAQSALTLSSLAVYINNCLPEVADTRARALAGLGAYPDAIRWWNGALKLDPTGTYVDPYVGLARMAEKAGRWKEELDYLRLAALGGGARDDNGIRAGDQAMLAGNMVSARRQYLGTVARAVAARGMTQFQAGDFALASMTWEEALSLDQNMAGVMHSLGGLAAQEERFADAIMWFGRALEADPGSSGIRGSLEKAREGKTALARLPRSEALAMGQPDTATHWMTLGAVYWNIGRGRSAEDAYRKALAIDRLNAPAWTGLALALANQGRLEEGVRACEEGIRANPEHVDPALNLAAMLSDLGRKAEAERRLKEAWRAFPGNPRVAAAMRQAGMAVPKLGDRNRQAQ